MSALKSGATVVGLLIAEEVLVTAKGGATAITGATGLIARAIDRIGDPSVAAIPDRRTTSTKTSTRKVPIETGRTGAQGTVNSSGEIVTRSGAGQPWQASGVSP